MYGRGDVYQVRPLGRLIKSEEDFEGCWRCDRLLVVRPVEFHVTLDMRRRRKIIRMLDRHLPLISQIENPLPRNPTPQMLAHWQTRLLQQAERIMTIKETE